MSSEGVEIRSTTPRPRSTPFPIPSFPSDGCARLRVRRTAPSADYDCVKTPISAMGNVHCRGNVEARVFTLLPIERCAPFAAREVFERDHSEFAPIIPCFHTYVDKKYQRITRASRGGVIFSRGISNVTRRIAHLQLVRRRSSTSRAIARHMWPLREKEDIH